MQIQAILLFLTLSPAERDLVGMWFLSLYSALLELCAQEQCKYLQLSHDTLMGVVVIRLKMNEQERVLQGGISTGKEEKQESHCRPGLA